MFPICWIKNLDDAAVNIPGKILAVSEEYQIIDTERIKIAESDTVYSLINDGKVQIGNGSEYLSGAAEQFNYLSSFSPHLIEIEKSPPFASPTHRTKRHAIAAPVTCAKNDSTNVEYKLTYDKYCKGGTVIVKNGEFGDYLTACVYDKDSVIPEAYRAALCEDWPVVSEYIEKEFLEYLGGDYTVHRISTHPLTAKITAGLYVRLTYHAIDAGVARTVLMNCDMTKEL